MKCPDIETIQKHIDNELSFMENEEYLKHLKECKHCKSIKTDYENDLEEIKHLIDLSKPPEINIPAFNYNALNKKKIKVVRLLTSGIIAAASIIILFFIVDALISTSNKIPESVYADDFTINYNLNQYLTYDYIVSVEPKKNQ
ncbi:MAG: zf-HC2 domain-containing protein [Hyphomicrobiales bacterium]